jgi:hypothetical protein
VDQYFSAYPYDCAPPAQKEQIYFLKSRQPIGNVLSPKRASNGENISLSLPPTVVQVKNIKT